MVGAVRNPGDRKTEKGSIIARRGKRTTEEKKIYWFSKKRLGPKRGLRRSMGEKGEQERSIQEVKKKKKKLT